MHTHDLETEGGRLPREGSAPAQNFDSASNHMMPIPTQNIVSGPTEEAASGRQDDPPTAPHPRPHYDRRTRDALYAEFEPLVRRLIRRYGQTHDMRQELPGEIYCRFCFLLDQYDPERGVPLRHYLVRQLDASVYTFVRKRWNMERREMGLKTDPSLDLSETTADPTPAWDEALVWEQLKQTLPAAISRLPRRQRQVVIWRYYQERSYGEIASLMGIQPATARSLLRHAMITLKQQIDH